MSESAGGYTDGEEGLDMELARPVSQADFQAAMKKVGPSITRGSEVSVSPGGSLHMCICCQHTWNIQEQVQG